MNFLTALLVAFALILIMVLFLIHPVLGVIGFIALLAGMSE